MTKRYSRRTFIEFLGMGAAGVTLAPLASCGDAAPEATNEAAAFALKGLEPSAADDILLAEGFEYDVLIRWGDPISATDRFGFNNDYIAYLPSPGNLDEGLLWVNHEYVNPLFVSGHIKGTEKSRAQVEKEMYDTGGSLIRVRRNAAGKWETVTGDPHNRRFTAFTEMPFNWPEPVHGSRTAVGTLGNCAGGVTPWGTILTCEECYQMCHGDRDFATGQRIPGLFGWEKHYDYPPEHYGWVVEVDPSTGKAQKHVALGRCAHECATVKEMEDGRVVVYTGDDENDQCLYKFIASAPRSLSEGTLYVANLEQGRWLPLDYGTQKALQEKFTGRTEVMVRLREAAAAVGGTPLDRPEDIEIDPLNGNVLVSLTNNIPKGNHTGSILKITEAGGRHDDLSFTSETFLAGGEETGFACPDNMAFDAAGNLWFTSDISGRAMNKPPYGRFRNNGLFVVPRQGGQAGKVIRVASAPFDAEFTGPFFAPDGESLFLSVQHPGETSPSADKPTSHWPDGDDAMPRPAVVVIRGEGIKALQRA